mgnify:FL=1
MIGQDKLAEERKRRAFSEQVASSAADTARLRAALIKYVRKTRTDTDRAGRFMGLKMTIDRRALDAASDDLNTTLRPEFGAIDGMDTEAQQDAAARMKARIDSNLEDAGFEGMRVQIELQPARARLVKVGL